MLIMAQAMNPAFKILHITRSIDPVGGCEIYIRNLISECLRNNFEIALAVANQPIDATENPELTPHVIPNLSSFEHQNARKAVFELQPFLSEFSPDLIHIHDLHNPYVIDACGQNYPTVKTTLNADAYCGGIDKYWYTSKKECHYRLGYGCLAVAYLENCMSRHPKRSLEIISIKKKALSALKSIFKVIVPSEASKKIMIQNGILAEQIAVIPLFANRDDQTRIVPYPRRKPPKVLFMGRLRPYKGVSYLLRSLPLISQKCEIQILGDGEERPALEKLTKELGIMPQVQFLGSVPHNHVGAYLDDCAVLVVPSVYPDSFPTVGLEAMRHARPVVGFRIGGIPEWLEDGQTGFLVESQNVHALAEKLNRILENPDRAEVMGLFGRNRFEERFTNEIHFETISNLYQEAITAFESKCTVAR